MDTVEGRLQTFSRSKAPWPHAHLSPQSMAMAGWYYRPAPGSIDNVTCFLCHKNLDGWSPEDNAWHEHVSHSKQCPLVQLDQIQSRERTFSNWPHSQPNAKQMAQAGFFFYPKERGDDTAYCFQCGCCLDGWEASDIPLYFLHHFLTFSNEHSRRFPRCPFLVNGRITEPAAFQRILACSSEKFVKELPIEKKEARPEAPKKIKSPEVPPGTVKKKPKNELETPMKETRIQPVSTARKAAEKKEMQSVKKPEKVRQPSDTELITQLNGRISDPNDLKLTVEQFLKKLVSDKLAAYDRRASEQIRSFETSLAQQ